MRNGSSVTIASPIADRPDHPARIVVPVTENAERQILNRKVVRGRIGRLDQLLRDASSVA
jgi:hypothetical protein